MQQQGPQSTTDPRQIMGGQTPRSIVPSGNGQPLERIAAMRRSNVEGVNTMQTQSPKSFPRHTQGQAMQRMPLPPQSPGTLGEEQQQTAYPVQGHRMPQTVPMSPGQRAAVPGVQLMAKSSQPTSVGMPGNAHPPQSPLSRSLFPPPRPIQPSSSRPAQIPTPTGFIPRASSSAETSLHRPTATYQQPAPSYPQQQKIRPAPPAYNSRPTYHGSYPPLAPKPAPDMGVQFSQQDQARKQIPTSTVAVGRYNGPPAIPSSSLQRAAAVRQNFQPQAPPPSMPPSPLLSPTLGSGQPFASPQHDLRGGFAVRNIRPTVALDSRQSQKEPLPG